MTYTCFLDGKQISTYDISDEEEDKIDFLLAAEAALEDLDKKNSRKYPDGYTLKVEVLSEKGNKMFCEVVKEMRPRYTAIDLNPKEDEDSIF